MTLRDADTVTSGNKGSNRRPITLSTQGNPAAVVQPMSSYEHSFTTVSTRGHFIFKALAAVLCRLILTAVDLARKEAQTTVGVGMRHEQVLPPVDCPGSA